MSQVYPVFFRGLLTKAGEEKVVVRIQRHGSDGYHPGKGTGMGMGRNWEELKEKTIIRVYSIEKSMLNKRKGRKSLLTEISIFDTY